MNVFRAINRWVRPYMYDDEIKIPKKERKETKKQVKLTKITKAHKKPTELEAVKRGQLGVKLITLKEVLDKDSAFQRLDKSDSHIAYYFHSSNKHQIAVRFEPQSGFRYYKRNDIKRKNFKPLIYPKYESSDKKHEEKVININQNHTIYWFVDVEKHRDSGGAYWTSTVWFEDGSLLDEKKFYDKSKFHWSE